jgi:hypothetical protein
MPGAFLCKGISSHIRIYGVVADEIDMRFVKNKHLGWQQEYSVIVYFFMAIKSPAKTFKMQAKDQ